jgi:DNA-binding NtrC family response regulator
MSQPDPSTIVHTGLNTSATQGKAPARAWVCRVVSGSSSGQELSIGARAVVVGAASECDLVLDDPKVSRRHAEIRATAGGVRVRDLGSTNGIHYRSSKITDAVVAPGESVRLGGTTLRINSVPVPVVAPSERQRFGALIGKSAPMREVFAILELASPTDATILIEGESGTGKELAASAVHDHSRRAARPFVVVDCGAVKPELLESHLFGHRKGAFTGAHADRRGAFVEASGGTVFLDEIGELPVEAQARLLRTLESRTVHPLGSDTPVDVDTRVIAATHRDLHAMVEEGTFRFDLFHRLAVVHLRIPALREHPEDIPGLVRHFYAGRGVDPGPISGDNLSELERHGWPGNVRELRNALERAWVLSGPDGAGFADLRLWLQPANPQAVEAPVDISRPFKEEKERVVEGFERRYLAEMFAACDYVIARAAERSGINRRHFRELLRKHGITRP